MARAARGARWEAKVRIAMCLRLVVNVVNECQRVNESQIEPACSRWVQLCVCEIIEGA